MATKHDAKVTSFTDFMGENWEWECSCGARSDFAWFADDKAKAEADMAKHVAESSKDPMTEVVWARNAWDPNTLDVGPAAYMLEVFEYDCDDWLRVAASYDLDAIKALANDYDLLPALIARFGNVFTPGEHRVTYLGSPIEL